MEGPQIQIAVSGSVVPLQPGVTTVGRGAYVDVRLADPSVSVLHAELVRRGPYVYVCDLGLSRNGTRVNGRLVGRRLLADGDALAFGSARCRVGGLLADENAEAELPKSAAPELTRRELDVIASLCRPAMSESIVLTKTIYSAHRHCCNCHRCCPLVSPQEGWHFQAAVDTGSWRERLD